MMCANKYEKPPKMTSMNVVSPFHPRPMYVKKTKFMVFYLTSQIFNFSTEIFWKEKLAKYFQNLLLILNFPLTDIIVKFRILLIKIVAAFCVSPCSYKIKE